jgi:polysaccharide export outer membrane protein
MKSNRAVRPARQGGPLAARIALILLSVLAVACASPPPTPEPPVVFEDYRVGAPDQLLVTVLPDPIIQESPVVRPDGKITIQLIGDVEAGERTPGEIASEIEERISRFKRGARATVSVVSANSSTFTVFGEVRGPGTFQIRKYTRLAEALGAAGGPTNFASLGSIQVVRSRDGRADVIEVDLGAIRGGDLTTNIQIQASDIIYVPPTILAKVGYVFQQLLFPLQPLLGLANSIAGSAIAAP